MNKILNVNIDSIIALSKINKEMVKLRIECTD